MVTFMTMHTMTMKIINDDDDGGGDDYYYYYYYYDYGTFMIMMTVSKKII